MYNQSYREVKVYPSFIRVNDIRGRRSITINVSNVLYVDTHSISINRGHMYVHVYALSESNRNVVLLSTSENPLEPIVDRALWWIDASKDDANSILNIATEVLKKSNLNEEGWEKVLDKIREYVELQNMLLDKIRKEVEDL